MSDDIIVLPKLDLHPANIHFILLIFAPASAPRKIEKNLTIVPPLDLPPALDIKLAKCIEWMLVLEKAESKMKLT